MTADRGEAAVPETAPTCARLYCQTHDVPNLFISGSGGFVTSAGLNLTLTILALAYRTADFIRDQWRRGAFEADV